MYKVSDTKPNSANRFMVWSEAIGVESYHYELHRAINSYESVKKARFPNDLWPDFNMEETYLPWLFQAVWSDEENCEVWSLVK